MQQCRTVQPPACPTGTFVSSLRMKVVLQRNTSEGRASSGAQAHNHVMVRCRTLAATRFLNSYMMLDGGAQAHSRLPLLTGRRHQDQQPNTNAARHAPP